MTDETATAEQPAPSLDEELSAAWDRMHSDPAADEAPIVEAAEPEKQTFDRPRDEAGRFAPIDKAAPAADEAAPAAATDQTTEQKTDQGPEAVEQAPTETVSQPPPAWSAAMRDHWTKLPEAVRSEIAKREADVSKFVSQTGPAAKAYQAVAQAIQPVAQQLQASGVAPAQYIERLVAADMWLRKDPAAAMQWLQQQYGAAAPASQPEAQATEPPGVDPALQPLLQRVSGLEAHLQRQAELQKEQAVARVQSDIDAFKGATGPDGQPLRPYFDRVSHVMAQLITAGQARGLDDAYATAIASDPGIKAERELATMKAEAAKRAASVNVRSSAAAVPAKGRTWEETVQQTADRLYA